LGVGTRCTHGAGGRNGCVGTQLRARSLATSGLSGHHLRAAQTGMADPLVA
jgi:hypothetical protein